MLPRQKQHLRKLVQYSVSIYQTFFSVTVEGQYSGCHYHLFTVPADALQSFDSEFIGLPKIEG